METRTAPYPNAALQQLVRNAVLHRTYESTNAPIRVYWFDDELNAQSRRSLGTVTVENFGTPGVTDYRNPHIADAMKVLGFVQRFGIGIATAKAERKEREPTSGVYGVARARAGYCQET